jgi:hypothetical protein
VPILSSHRPAVLAVQPNPRASWERTVLSTFSSFTVVGDEVNVTSRIDSRRHCRQWILPMAAARRKTRGFSNYRVEEMDAVSLANLPGDIDGSQYRRVDLDGGGISRMLTEQAPR